MALTLTTIPVNPAAGSPGDSSRAAIGNASDLKMTLTSITVGVAGDYATGGIVLTPQQLGFATGVQFGVVAPRTTTVTTGTAVGGVLDCTSPAAPKLKLNTAAGEAAGAGVAGDVFDVLAFGY